MLVIYVSHIHPWVTERELFQIFSIFGVIEDVEFIKSDSEASERIGLVVFRFDHDASEAARCFNGASISIGNNIGVRVVSQNSQKVTRDIKSTASAEEFASKSSMKLVDENTLVFVKNFGDLLDDIKLKIIFEIFGEVKSVSIKRENGKSKGFGFVDFTEHSCAVEAISVMNGRKIYGKKKIIVAFAQRKEERERQLSGSEGTDTNETVKNSIVLYVKNLPKSFTVEDLGELFEKFGVVASVSIKTKEKASTAVGFVSFKVPEDALRAQKHMHGQRFQSQTLEVFIKGEQDSKIKAVSKPIVDESPKQLSRNAIGHLFVHEGKRRMI